METEGRLYIVKTGEKSITIKEGENGTEIEIEVGRTYPFNREYKIDGLNVIPVGTHSIYYFRLLLKDISTTEEKMIYDRRICSYDVMKCAAWTSDSSRRKELKEIARRGPISGIEIRVQDGEVSVLEHREFGEMDIIHETRDKEPVNRIVLSGTYAEKKDKQILRFEFEDEVELDNDIHTEHEKKPKEIVLEVEPKTKKEAK